MRQSELIYRECHPFCPWWAPTADGFARDPGIGRYVSAASSSGSLARPARWDSVSGSEECLHREETQAGNLAKELAGNLQDLEMPRRELTTVGGKH